MPTARQDEHEQHGGPAHPRHEALYSTMLAHESILVQIVTRGGDYSTMLAHESILVISLSGGKVWVAVLVLAPASA